MRHFNQIQENLRSNLPFFTIIGVFVAILIGFKEFQEDKLPVFLKHNLLLIYLFFLFGTAQLLIIACILKPLVSSRGLLLLFERIFDASKLIGQNSLQIIMITFLMLSMGTIMIYSSTRLEALLKFGNPYYFFTRHTFSIFLGLIFCLLSFSIKYNFINRIATPFIILSILLLIVGLSPQFGTSVGGAKRWITIGSFSINYFEQIKVTIIIYLSNVLSKKKLTFFSIIPVGLIFSLMFLLDKKYSIGAMSLLTMVMILMTIAKFNLKYAVYVLIVIEFICLLFFSLPLYEQSQRLGGFLGVGIGESQYKLDLQFEAFTGFIFLLFTEELGLIGDVIIILLFLIFTMQGIRTSLRTSDTFARLLVFGAVGMISLQAFQNIGTTLKVLPFEENSLPFISYGHSQIVINMFLVGFILNATKRIRIGNLIGRLPATGR